MRSLFHFSDAAHATQTHMTNEHIVDKIPFWEGHENHNNGITKNN